ncbi:MAG TPA: phosphatase PAP2 family protein [Sphingomicrobium sp.]|jgi:undecaprenyl-diphosphatase
MTSTVLLTRVLPLSALAILFLAMFYLGTGEADKDVLFSLYARDVPWLAATAFAVTQIGGWWTVVAVTILGALWLLYRGDRWAALTLLIASLGGRLLVVLQKDYFARLRPDEHLRLVEVQSDSFPSGHSANPMVAYLPLALLLFRDPRQQRIAAAFAISLALLSGISRPMLGVHWPSDVVAGWSFGLLWVALVFAVMERWKPAIRR